MKFEELPIGCWFNVVLKTKPTLNMANPYTKLSDTNQDVLCTKGHDTKVTMRSCCALRHDGAGIRKPNDNTAWSKYDEWDEYDFTITDEPEL